jgi:hypothetical protein
MGRLMSFRRVLLTSLLLATLLPFACRQLLSLGLRCPRFFSQISYSNTGQGRRLGKNLIRLLDSQAKEFDSKLQSPPLPCSDPAVSSKPIHPEGDEKKVALFNSRSTPFHSSYSNTPLRI